MSTLALVVGLFLIYNTVTFSVVQRRSVLGIMRSLGTTRRADFPLYLAGSLNPGRHRHRFLVWRWASFLGVERSRWFRKRSAIFISAWSVQRISVPPLTLIKGAAIGMGASLLAAAIPSWDATRTAAGGRDAPLGRRSADAPPAAAMSQSGPILMNLLGLLLLVVPGGLALELRLLACASSSAARCSRRQR